MSRSRFFDSYGMLKDRYVALFAGVGLVVFVVVLTLAIVVLSRWQGRIICHRWSEQTSIATKFVILSVGDTGQCLARTPDGRWILNSHWSTYVQGQK